MRVGDLVKLKKVPRFGTEDGAFLVLETAHVNNPVGEKSWVKISRRNPTGTTGVWVHSKNYEVISESTEAR
jgi:ubiquinone/menaquinone biosynthesis C-methylase UbiE